MLYFTDMPNILVVRAHTYTHEFTYWRMFKYFFLLFFFRVLGSTLVHYRYYYCNYYETMLYIFCCCGCCLYRLTLCVEYTHTYQQLQLQIKQITLPDSDVTINIYEVNEKFLSSFNLISVTPLSPAPHPTLCWRCLQYFHILLKVEPKHTKPPTNCCSIVAGLGRKLLNIAKFSHSC